MTDVLITEFRGVFSPPPKKKDGGFTKMVSGVQALYIFTKASS